MKIKNYYDVVIIDSGLNSNEISSGIGITIDYNGEIMYDDCFVDDIGHGTAIHSIIKMHNNQINCFHIKIFNRNNTYINEKALLAALNYVYYNIECKIINMSLGLAISICKDELYEICQKIKEKGIILVAAFDNMETISYPAAFDNVIGVASSPACSQITDVVFYDNSIVNVCAKGGLQRVTWISPKYIFTQGNSYACAHISGILSNSSSNNMNSALAYLKNISIQKFLRPSSRILPNYPGFCKGSRAVMFPFNKEMHSLIRFKDMLCLKIIDVYDLRQSARVNASVNKLLNLNLSPDYIIKNIETIEWDSFEVFVLGHTAELASLTKNPNLCRDLVLNAYNHGKYIYCFDDISNIVAEHSLDAERVFYPKTTLNNVEHIPLGMLYRPWVPMIGVFGTTSKQGKYTLQLILRQKFLRDNYRVGQIGTEPSAYLFEMDLCFHFGYHSTTNVNRRNMVSYLNSAINSISQKNVDIIISGCQSGTVVNDFGNVNYYTFSQNEFLLGTLPDAVVLCVNSYDEPVYIKRTIQYIESCVEGKVVALVLYPMGYDEQLGKSRRVRLSDTDLMNIAMRYREQFNVSTYILGNEDDMENLYSHIVSFFASTNEV